MSDLSALETAYPGWRFVAKWIASASGPDLRTILAIRNTDGHLVGGLTVAEVREKVRREEDQAART